VEEKLKTTEIITVNNIPDKALLVKSPLNTHTPNDHPSRKDAWLQCMCRFALNIAQKRSEARLDPLGSLQRSPARLREGIKETEATAGKREGRKGIGKGRRKGNERMMLASSFRFSGYAHVTYPFHKSFPCHRYFLPQDCLHTHSFLRANRFLSLVLFCLFLFRVPYGRSTVGCPSAFRRTLTIPAPHPARPRQLPLFRVQTDTCGWPHY